MLPYVNDVGSGYCISANYPFTESAPVARVNCEFDSKTKSEYRAPTPWVIGASKGWLRTITIGGRCAFIKDGILWDEQCDRNKKYPAWEWYYPTGARLKEEYCHNDKCGRCPKPNSDNVWEIMPCDH
jgi:hypothetical protein